MKTKTFKSTKIWPTPILLFHWSLPLLFILSYLSSLSNQYLYAHLILGATVFTLLIWRFLYGFSGPEIVRYKYFLKNPIILFKHLMLVIKGETTEHLGHTPPAGWMLIITQGLFVLLMLSGLIALFGKDQYQIGFLKLDVSMGLSILEVHLFLFYSLLLLVFIHLLGVIRESQIRQYNIVIAFITGKKNLDIHLKNKWQQLNKKNVWRGKNILIITTLILFGFLIINITQERQQAFNNAHIEPLWSQECGSCHELYHPSLLSAQSWKAITNQLENHFDEDASLDVAEQKEIEHFLVSNSNKTSPYKIAYFLQSNKKDSITKSTFWKNKHIDIKPIMKQHFPDKNVSQCTLCHQDAESGRFASLKISF